MQNYSSIVLRIQVELKNIGYKEFEEICVYQVKNDKIILSNFLETKIRKPSK